MGRDAVSGADVGARPYPVPADPVRLTAGKGKGPGLSYFCFALPGPFPAFRSPIRRLLQLALTWRSGLALGMRDPPLLVGECAVR